MSFVERLLACTTHGLSTSDLKHWFDVPYATMWTWLHGERTPTPKKRHLNALDKLEQHIKRHNGFPVPFEINSHKRPRYIRRMRDGHERARLPRLDPSR